MKESSCFKLNSERNAFTVIQPLAKLKMLLFPLFWKLQYLSHVQEHKKELIITLVLQSREIR